MISFVKALPKVGMEQVKDLMLQRENAAVISIIDPGAEHVFERNTHRILTLEFSDLEPTSFLRGSWFEGTKEKYMDHHQAERIVAMIHRLVCDEKDFKLFVNCSAGIARSGAIVTFAHAFSSMKDTHFVAENPHIKPNWWVLMKLIEVWHSNFPELIRSCEYQIDEF